MQRTTLGIALMGGCVILFGALFFFRSWEAADELGATPITTPLGSPSCTRHDSDDVSPAILPIIGQKEQKILQPSNTPVSRPLTAPKKPPQRICENLRTSAVQKTATLQHAAIPDTMQKHYELLAQQPPEKRQRPFFAAKDRLMKKVETKSVLDEGSLALFVNLFGNNELDLVTRDYALQHLGALLVRLEEDPDCGKLLSPDEQALDAHAVIWQATNEIDSSIAGTALLAMNRLSEFDDNVDAGRVHHQALSIVQNPEASTLARATAFQFCSREALGVARSLADSSEHLAEKSAAIAMIGRTGDPQDALFLQQIEKQAAPQFKTVIDEALKTLTRLNGGDA